MQPKIILFGPPRIPTNNEIKPNNNELQISSPFLALQKQGKKKSHGQILFPLIFLFKKKKIPKFILIPHTSRIERLLPPSLPLHSSTSHTHTATHPFLVSETHLQFCNLNHAGRGPIYCSLVISLKVLSLSFPSLFFTQLTFFDHSLTLL